VRWQKREERRTEPAGNSPPPTRWKAIVTYLDPGKPTVYEIEELADEGQIDRQSLTSALRSIASNIRGALYRVQRLFGVVPIRTLFAKQRERIEDRAEGQF
jgi:hypothetical protein